MADGARWWRGGWSAGRLGQHERFMRVLNRTDSRVERAASHAALGTEGIPARRFPREKAISTKASDSQSRRKPEGETLIARQAEVDQHDGRTSGAASGTGRR